jgi:hypothetical protein
MNIGTIEFEVILTFKPTFGGATWRNVAARERGQYFPGFACHDCRRMLGEAMVTHCPYCDSTHLDRVDLAICVCGDLMRLNELVTHITTSIGVDDATL